ncbi:transposase [Sinorhizobium saheli]|nr:transposase [Sinorhizobium saheli]MQW86352.1 transposase [Sinorhizobium saheli]
MASVAKCLTTSFATCLRLSLPCVCGNLRQERRHRWGDEQKLDIVMSVGVSGATVTEVAHRHDMTRQQIYACSELKDLIWKLESRVRDYSRTKFGPISEKLDLTQMELGAGEPETAIAETQAGRLHRGKDRGQRARSRQASLAKSARAASELAAARAVIYQVIVTIRPKYACPEGITGVVQAESPAHLLEGSWPVSSANGEHGAVISGQSFASSCAATNAISGELDGGIIMFHDANTGFATLAYVATAKLPRSPN